MLFSKKTKFSVSEKQIKEDILSDNGMLLVRLNLRYPNITCPKRDPLIHNAVPFYPRLAEGIAYYARSDLKKAAMSAYNSSPDGFMPFSAVMRWEKTFENESYLSLLIDISVCDGIEPPMTERKTQVWERKFGTKCRFSQFFKSKSIDVIKDYVGEENKKRFDRELFTLSENGAVFYLRDNGGYTSVEVPYTVSEK